MNPDDMDRILAGGKNITPSPGFLPSVMKAVEAEAAAPQPATFPWLRALPGLLALLAALVVAIGHGIGVLTDPTAAGVFDEQARQLTAAAAGIELQWIVVAVTVTVISMMVPSCLVGDAVGGSPQRH